MIMIKYILCIYVLKELLKYYVTKEWNQIIIIASKNVKEREPFYTVGRNITQYMSYGNQYGASSENKVTIRPAMWASYTAPERIKMSQKYLCILVCWSMTRNGNIIEANLTPISSGMN